MRLIFLALIPCSAILIALSEPITRLVYERGEFDAAATERRRRPRCSGSPSASRSPART